MPPRIVYSDENAVLGSFKQLQATLFLRQMQPIHVKPIASLRQQLLDEYSGKLRGLIVLEAQCIAPVPAVRDATLALMADPNLRSVGTAVVIQGASAMAATLRTMVSSMLLASRSDDRLSRLFSDVAPAGEFLSVWSKNKMSAEDIVSAIDFARLSANLGS